MSSFLEKTKVVSSDAVRALMTSLYQAVGNKRYLHDLEQFLNGLEITPDSRLLSRVLAKLRRKNLRQIDFGDEFQRVF